MKVPGPSLYLSVENVAREFDSKLLLASEMVRRSITVVIGQQWLLNENLEFMPPGFVFFKGLNRVQAANMMVARKFGHAVVANDEEAVGIADHRHMMRDVSSEVSIASKMIFCHGEIQREWLADAIPNLRGRLVVVGNPRIDLLRPEFRALHQAEANRIRANHGKFVLFNTNAGGINSKWGSLERYAQILVQIGWIDPNKAEDREILIEHLEFDQLNMNEIKSLIEILRSSLRDHTLIIRPHPAERFETWVETFGSAPNIKIIQEGSHIPWILASDLLLHTGCTTGLEAQVAGHPTISLRPGSSRARFFHMSNMTNVTADRADSAATMVHDYLYNNSDLFVRTKPELDNMIARYFTGITGRFAFERTADALANLFKSSVSPDAHLPWKPLAGFRTEMARSDLQRGKMTLTSEELRARLTLLQSVLGRSYTVRFEQIADSMFVLRPHFA